MDTPVPGSSKNSPVEKSDSQLRNKSNRGKKRKRLRSESSSDVEDVLPENTLEVEKNLHASAVKNNLDAISVKKILKKVVTNDHVLALVKLREEEEAKAMEMESLQPKLTRSKVKELMKVSPNTAWNLENMALTPIKHIPVKTRPEVEALITQELQEDEDDDEYEPTHDDVPSDDDHTLESCSDVDSQPRTPATPRRLGSPRVLRDGPFKVPQDVSTPRCKLDMDEDATIALRTRSKLSLSSIPIDHIESSFVPPDELPLPAVDMVWTEFLQECMNPETSKNEDDDDDPEYNVAADPDAHDEDEEGLENIIKISKKELNDLVTELFNIMPESAEDALNGKLAAGTVQNGSKNQPTVWEGKQEPRSDSEETRPAPVTRAREKRISIGKTEPPSDNECTEDPPVKQPRVVSQVQTGGIVVSVVEAAAAAHPAAPAPAPPAPLRGLLAARATLRVQLASAEILPDQIKILEQQLRQHVQLAASNFLQLYAHPVHWNHAPTFREYLETLGKIAASNPKSVANVCNLEPALTLVRSWEESMSADTPDNAKIIKFVQEQIDRARRRAAQNNLYVGDFHERFMTVVANSPVFLYPHLLPPIPFRSDITKRFNYLRCEDELLALALDEFWQYIEDNPDLYQVPKRRALHRWGLSTVLQLICKHMLTWISPKQLHSHIAHLKRLKDKDNPLYRFFKKREVKPYKHVLLPFNPKLTLYEQPEDEMPRRWIKHLMVNSTRFRDYYFKYSGFKKAQPATPVGVPVTPGGAATPPPKKPLPFGFRDTPDPNSPATLAPKPSQDKFDIHLSTPANPNPPPPAPILYSVVQTLSGAYLVPLSVLTNTANTTTTASTQETVANNLPEESNVPTTPQPTSRDHCNCCIRIRKICKEKQTRITDFFSPVLKVCPCKERRNTKYPKISKKLRLLLNKYKTKGHCAWQGLLVHLRSLKEEFRMNDNNTRSQMLVYEWNEIADVTSFQLKLSIRTSDARNKVMKRKVNTLLSRFRPETDDPYILIRDMSKALEAECVDLWREFLGLLTAEQADEIGKFVEYFKQECLTDLMVRIEEQVSNRHHRLRILEDLRRLLANSTRAPCELCAGLLDALRGYPALARHVFSLFPHRLGESDTPVTQPNPPQRIEQPTEVAESNCCENSFEMEDEEDDINCTEAENAEKQAEGEAVHESRVNYEADHSESDDEDNLDNLTIVEECEDDGPVLGRIIKSEEVHSENVIDTPHLTITKTEVQDPSESDISMMMSEDEIKSEVLEPQEWKRDEDKLLLEVLQKSLTPEERRDKTILEIIDEKNVLYTVAKSLNKSLSDIRQRIMYLLQMIVNSD